MNFLDKFAPKKLDECIGNKAAISRLRQWFLGFMVSKKQKPLLLYGPSGCGKSAAIAALINEYEATAVFVHPPQDSQEAEKLKIKLENLTHSKTLFSTTPLVVFENIDGWSSEKSKSFMSFFMDLFKSNSIPIILTANDIYDQSISSIKILCEPLQFKALSPDEIFVRLIAISQSSNIFLPKEQIKIIAKNSKGDLRAAINDLWARNFSASREQDKNQFEMLRSIFRLQSYQEAKTLSSLLSSTSDLNTIKLFLAQNILLEFKKTSEIAKAYERLSKADVFDGRIINKQYWGFLRYSIALMFFGVASVREERQYSYFVPYQFPEFLKKMSYSKSRREIKKSILLKIAKKTHTTTFKAESYLDLLAAQTNLFKSKIEDKLISFYGLDESEINFLNSYSKH
ncbi:MAG: AAA family ATPase [Candidatus Anstonellaceae archaeon]